MGHWSPPPPPVIRVSKPNQFQSLYSFFVLRWPHKLSPLENFPSITEFYILHR